MAPRDRRILVTLDGDDALVLDVHLLAASDSAEGTDALDDTIGRDQPGLEGFGKWRLDGRTAPEFVTGAQLPDDRPFEGAEPRHASRVSSAEP